jgi:hypothetical protein
VQPIPCQIDDDDEYEDEDEDDDADDGSTEALDQIK